MEKKNNVTNCVSGLNFPVHSEFQIKMCHFLLNICVWPHPPRYSLYPSYFLSFLQISLVYLVLLLFPSLGWFSGGNFHKFSLFNNLSQINFPRSLRFSKVVPGFRWVNHSKTWDRLSEVRKLV